MENRIFKPMLNWAIKTIYSDLSCDVWKSCLNLSDGIIVDPREKQHSCLLEFRHGDNRSIDISFRLLSSLATVSDASIPNWWHNYLSRCDKLDANSINKHDLFLGEINEDVYSKKYDPMLPYCLPDCHFLEFDTFREGSRLAGIFQRVHLLEKECDPSCILMILERALEFSGSCFRYIPGDQILKDLCSAFGLPAWIGYMHGRNKMIKLVFQVSEKRDCDFEQALRWFSPGFGHQFRQAIAGMNKHENASFRICLDLMLNEYIANPRFCVEVFPDSGVQEARTLTLAKQLQITQHFPKSALEDIENVHHKLPCGKTRAWGNQALEGCSNKSIKSIAAVLSHYKICYEIVGEPLLKTYVSLVAEID